VHGRDCPAFSVGRRLNEGEEIEERQRVLPVERGALPLTETHCYRRDERGRRRQGVWDAARVALEGVVAVVVDVNVHLVVIVGGVVAYDVCGLVAAAEQGRRRRRWRWRARPLSRRRRRRRRRCRRSRRSRRAAGARDAA